MPMPTQTTLLLSNFLISKNQAVYTKGAMGNQGLRTYHLNTTNV